VNGRIAAAIARHERHATSSWLRRLDRNDFDAIETRDGPIDESFDDTAPRRPHRRLLQA
jgi:hypothetical protein